jgi:hypothetical protein
LLDVTVFTPLYDEDEEDEEADVPDRELIPAEWEGL